MNATIRGKQYDIGAGYLGNGLTFWNRAEEINGDYKKIGHISEAGEVTLEGSLPEEVKQFINRKALKRLETEVETRLINLLTKIEMDLPSNFKEMLSFIVEDLKATKDPIGWGDKDLAESLRKFIEL
jgi:hypothetical protein